MAKAIEQQMPGLEHLPDIPDLIYDRLKANPSHAEVHLMLLKTLREVAAITVVDGSEYGVDCRSLVFR